MERTGGISAAGDVPGVSISTLRRTRSSWQAGGRTYDGRSSPLRFRQAAPDAKKVDLGVSVLRCRRVTRLTDRKHTRALLKRLRRSSRALSRKKRGSGNAARAKRRLARLHARIANVRKDATHKATPPRARLENLFLFTPR